jgi:glycosyltransferase involved in cell wall biosynthesis
LPASTEYIVRIAYLNPCGQLGGAEISLLDLLRSMRAAQPDWELWLVLGEDGPLAERARELGVQAIVEHFPGGLARLGDTGTRLIQTLWHSLQASAGIIAYARRLRRKLSDIKPQIIHTNGFKMHLLGLWTKPSKTPVVWHIRDYVSSRPLMKRMLGLYGSRCAAMIANSESVARDVQSVCGPKRQTHCVYNAVNLTEYSPEGEKADLDGLSGVALAKTGVVRIGLIATLARWKGHEVFLRALAALPANLQYRAYIVGGAIYQTENSQYAIEDLQKLASHLNISNKVGFTGFVARPAQVMRALDIIVHASTQPEPFGRVIAEGMACGRAVICSAAGGASELITDGYDALAHQPGDHQGLADRIMELASNPELRAQLGRAGRATAERRFKLSRLASEVVPIYQRVVSETTLAAPVQLAASR